MNRSWFFDQIRDLESEGFSVEVYRDLSRVIASSIDLGGGGWTDSDDWPIHDVKVMIDISPDFPLTVPGIGYTHPRYAIHIPLIKHGGYMISDLHECEKHPPWYWLCFEEIDWNPRSDNLITLLQIIEVTIYRRR